MDSVKYIGMDVHKEAISLPINAVTGEVKCYFKCPVIRHTFQMH